jgi:hypothetical protein
MSSPFDESGWFQFQKFNLGTLDYLAQSSLLARRCWPQGGGYDVGDFLDLLPDIAILRWESRPDF